METFKYTYVSAAITKMRGFSPHEMTRMTSAESFEIDSFNKFHFLFLERAQSFLSDAKHVHSHYIDEMQMSCKDGSHLWVEISSSFYRNPKTGKLELRGVSRNISSRKKNQEEILYLSYHDKLTGIYNRRFFEEELKRLDTDRNLPISIIIGDVNGLKLVNDAFGHEEGDRLLIKAAKSIQSTCRSDDILARWGGDEFVMFLPGTPKDRAEAIIKRIRTLYAHEFVHAIRINISFGCHTKTKKEEDLRFILKSAEDIMYKNKILENDNQRGNIINTIIKSLHEKNPREEQHSARVGTICQSIGKAVGLSRIELNRLKIVGHLHDIGKIAIHDDILNKKGTLTEKEYDEMARHPDIGYRILSAAKDMQELADYTLAHHERWDGTGYPKGLKEKEIPLVARIIAIADAYDAITSTRAYRSAKEDDYAIEEIKRHAGTQFDPEIVDIFMKKVLIPNNGMQQLFPFWIQQEMDLGELGI
jgi:diguanylate cyclase (GGDEF)-like protein/PAS domain S-box-containing protein